MFVARANQLLIQCKKPSTAMEGKRVQQPKLMDRVDLETQKDAARGSGVQTPVIYNTVLSPRPMHPPPYNAIILILYIIVCIINCDRIYTIGYSHQDLRAHPYN